MFPIFKETIYNLQYKILFYFSSFLQTSFHQLFFFPSMVLLNILLLSFFHYFLFFFYWSIYPSFLPSLLPTFFFLSPFLLPSSIHSSLFLLSIIHFLLSSLRLFHISSSFHSFSILFFPPVLPSIHHPYFLLFIPFSSSQFHSLIFISSCP